MGTTIELAAADGHRFAAYRAEPAGKPRGALVVIQEIHCDQRGSYHAESAKLARTRSLEFLRRCIG